MRLDTSVLHAPVLDHRGLDLAAARRVRYVLEQSFRYEYDAPVESLRQRLVIVPPARHGNQYLRAHRLEVTGAQVRRRVRRDAAGNVVAWPTQLTSADDRLRAMAADIVRQAARPGKSDPEEVAERICAAVFAAISYEYGVTSVTTTAAGALAGGRGVCQDFAHVMLALCHLLELPARYVSGHLLGQGGTHAWVEVIVPRAGHAEAVAFDPCNGRRTDGGYVTVATGRDYSDVAPTSGSYVGTSPGRLTAGRRVAILAAA